MLNLHHSFVLWNVDFRRLAVATAAVGVFFGVLMTLQHNFIVEELGMEAQQLGIVEAFRETPGFFNFVFLAIMIALSPPVAATICLILMGLGIAAFSQVETVVAFTAFSVVWSIGFHAWHPLSQTMGLMFSPPEAKGKALGELRAVEGLAWLLTILVCKLLFDYLNYSGLFVIAGVACVLGAVVIFGATRKRIGAVDRSFLLRKKYWLFYTLQFLQGCRKQIFITFAVFALVKVHGMPIHTTIWLMFINQLLIFLTGSWFGRLIDRFGERVMMSISYVVLACVFVGYGVIEHRPTLYVLYCIDNLVFFGAIALTTYLHRIAPPDDLKPSLSMGVMFNHISSVTAPLIGGFAWHFFGYQVIFIAGAVFALISLGFAQLLPNKVQEA
ncbi:MAG: MFS transporter [Verrucomicrobiae bacterium]|nr:MFS transporter [Verrucomicrobiae bacterium]